MNVKRLESYLTRLSLMFRRFFLDMRLSYDFSDSDDVAQVTISKVSKGHGVSLIPTAIFAVSDTSVKFLKLNLASEIDFEEYEVSSFFELRCIVLYVVYSLIQVEHSDLTFFDFLSKIFSSRIESPEDLFEYFLKVNEIPYNKDPDYLYVYDYGNFQFYKDAISFFSIQSVRVVYKIDTQFSAFSVVGVVFDSVYATLFPDRVGDESQEPRVFAEETFAEEEELPPDEGEDGFGGFGGDAGFGGDEGFGGGGGGSESIPVEGGGSELGGFGGAPGVEGE